MINENVGGLWGNGIVAGEFYGTSVPPISSN